MDVLDSTACSHEAEAPPWLERPNQDQPTPPGTLHQHIEHPVHTVIQVNVDCPGRVSFHECSGARPRKRVAGFVIQGQIGLCLDNNA